MLHESFLDTLHARMFGHVWRWAGTYRRSDKNIGIEWYRIPVELRQLLEDARFWVENESFGPDEIAAENEIHPVNNIGYVLFTGEGQIDGLVGPGSVLNATIHQ